MSMIDVTKIIIKGSSGYCCFYEGYHDKVTITPESIAYEYEPMYESELNPQKKWSYKTTSPIFKFFYEKLTGMLPLIMNIDNEIDCTDKRRLYTVRNRRVIYS